MTLISGFSPSPVLRYAAGALAVQMALLLAAGALPSSPPPLAPPVRIERLFLPPWENPTPSKPETAARPKPPAKSEPRLATPVGSEPRRKEVPAAAASLDLNAPPAKIYLRIAVDEYWLAALTAKSIPLAFAQPSGPPGRTICQVPLLRGGRPGPLRCGPLPEGVILLHLTNAYLPDSLAAALSHAAERLNKPPSTLRLYVLYPSGLYQQMLALAAAAARPSLGAAAVVTAAWRPAPRGGFTLVVQRVPVSNDSAPLPR